MKEALTQEEIREACRLLQMSGHVTDHELKRLRALVDKFEARKRELRKTLLFALRYGTTHMQ